MPDKPQFTLKWLLVEVALVAVFLGLLSWNLPSPPGRANGLHEILWICIAAPVLFAVAGAIIGGLFGRFGKGAFIGVTLYMVFIALAVVMSYLVVAWHL